jgi:hypothetical protein
LAAPTCWNTLGATSVARMAITTITTRISISVKPDRRYRWCRGLCDPAALCHLDMSRPRCGLVRRPRRTFGLADSTRADGRQLTCRPVSVPRQPACVPDSIDIDCQPDDAVRPPDVNTPANWSPVASPAIDEGSRLRDWRPQPHRYLSGARAGTRLPGVPNTCLTSSLRARSVMV